MMADRTVLVVDDEPGVVQLVRTLLADEGYKVQVAENGAQALDLLEGTPVDLILLDLMMPNMSGWELLERLRGRRAGNTPPVAILSAVIKDEAVRRAYEEYGARAYITKPFRIQELIQTVERLVPRS